ncbi:MAG TPA: GWxTD domain-containing protein [Vicinamibacteria bacterium]|nr:GWxTD domain-containing protein [Vicinamibacteria bacterium]
MISAAVLALAGAVVLPEMSEAHRKWIDEEVVYIITDKEKEVFLSLQTVEERERFIEAFWVRRDPNPATPSNELKEEHYRRIEHSNRFLGRDTFRPGWRTDRGRYYILLGEPKITQRFSGSNDIVDSELWFYQGGSDKGLPGAFYLLFFQRDGVGELELYHPVGDGPQQLFRSASVVLPDTNNLAAVELLEELSPDLAHASLSYDAGQPPDLFTGRASLGTDSVLARIEESPKRAIRTDYLDAWLRYGNRVAADYSFNFVPNRSAFGVLVGPERTAIVHYGIELDPENFGLASDEEKTKFYTTLDVTVEARNAGGTLVFANERSDFVELSSSQVQAIERFPVAYHDTFPLVPGRYTVSIILRNRVLKRYTVAEAEILVPDFSRSGAALTEPILGYRTEQLFNVGSESEMRAFQLGSLRLEPSADGYFAIGDTIFAFTQAIGTPSEAQVHFELLLGDEVLDRQQAPARESGAALAELATLGAVGGNYLVRARLLRADGTVLAESSAPAILSPRSVVARPNFVYRRGFNAGVPGLLPLVLGDQWSMLQKSDLAGAEYEKAVAAANQKLPQARWKLAYHYLSQNRTAEALELLASLEEAFPSQYEVVAGLGIAYSQAGDDARAVSYLERALTLRPPSTRMLNALGESQERLGDLEKAKGFYQRSLDLDPDQPAVRERLARLVSK